MKPIENWRAELNRLWSVRIAILMTFLAIADQAFQQVQAFVPPIAYAALSIVFILARLWMQKRPQAGS